MRRREGRRGNAMVEFALSAVLLVLVLSGVFLYGYTMYVYNALQAAVTNGATYAQTATYDARNTSYETAVKNMVVYGNTAGMGSRLVPGLGTAQVAVTRTPANGYPQTVTVKVSSLTVNSALKSFTFNNRPNVTVRFAGEYFTND